MSHVSCGCTVATRSSPFSDPHTQRHRARASGQEANCSTSLEPTSSPPTTQRRHNSRAGISCGERATTHPQYGTSSALRNARRCPSLAPSRNRFHTLRGHVTGRLACPGPVGKETKGPSSLAARALHLVGWWCETRRSVCWTAPRLLGDVGGVGLQCRVLRRHRRSHTNARRFVANDRVGAGGGALHDGFSDDVVSTGLRGDNLDRRAVDRYHNGHVFGRRSTDTTGTGRSPWPGCRHAIADPGCSNGVRLRLAERTGRRWRRSVRPYRCAC